MKTQLAIVLAGVLAAANGVLMASDAVSLPGDTVPVTPDNFNRAESDMYFARIVKAAGGLGKFDKREPPPIDKQDAVHANRDICYSGAVLDLDAGPVTITLPDAGKRFISLVAINEEQYVPAIFYSAGAYTFTKEQIGTRYVLLGTRTLVDPTDPKDLERVHAWQDAVKLSQASAGRFEVPNWDATSQANVREALLILAITLPDLNRAFGTKAQTDPIRHLIGTAMNWGGNPIADAVNLNIKPTKNDGATIYKLHVKDVPVDGFWSVSVYNAAGYFEPNPYDTYSLNSMTANKTEDGSIVVQFGGCDGKTTNCLPTTPGWHYVVRLYRPRAEILSGKWTFPEAQPQDARDLALASRARPDISQSR